jgi:hypothetical protein
MSGVQKSSARRGSLLEPLGTKTHASKKAQTNPNPSSDPNLTTTTNTSTLASDASTFSGSTIDSRTSVFHRGFSVSADGAEKPHREHICDNGPFKLLTDPVTGKSRLVENNRWPLGVEY